jgi:hypothetical protein
MVRLPWTPEFDAERERFAFRYCCEDCAHFDAPRERCRHEWPNELHREREKSLVPEFCDFCKEFELC